MRARICLPWESCCSKWRRESAVCRRHRGGSVRSPLEPAATSPLTLNPALPRVSRGDRRQGAREGSRATLSIGRRVSARAEACRRLDFSRGFAGVHRTDTEPSSSLVVLPFVDLSPGKDQEYFCHGITEEIINALTRVPGVRVISRTSAFAFHGKGLDITEIGRRLRVGAALEGSVRKAGNRVRVTAQLVNAEDGYQIWSKRFDRDLSDVFAIQDEIASIILGELRSGLASPPAGKRGSFDVVAHDAYLRGMYALNKWSEDSMRGAIADFREAIAQDSGFAPAYAALAEGHMWLYSGLGVLPAPETVPHARSAVERALALDPTLADAHKVGALIAMNHDWDRRGSEKALTRALQYRSGFGGGASVECLATRAAREAA